MLGRQSTTPVQFNRTTTGQQTIAMTSFRAGVVNPVGYDFLNRGDSASGQTTMAFELAEMPRPLQNGVMANVQAWFVPFSAHPKFSGYDEFMHSYQGETIKTIDAADRDPPSFFTVLDQQGDLDLVDQSKFARTMGIHLVQGQPMNTYLIDAFSLIYNFRLAAHSNKLTRRAYASEDLVEALSLPRAFWPSGHFRDVVPDYERALIVGNLDLDIQAGSIPIQGLAVTGGDAFSNRTGRETGGVDHTGRYSNSSGNLWHPIVREDPDNPGYPLVQGLLGENALGATLADIDKARQSQAFAKLRASMQGNDATGFDNDNAIMAELMQGYRVPDEMLKRPFLLDSQRVRFNFAERHATDAANLDDSVTLGDTSATLRINIPQQDSGGVIIYTVEILPEQLHERQGDPWLHFTDVNELPNALRDVQRPEPVDEVMNWRIDARHADPQGLYGFEPMNNKFNRMFTKLGGEFYQEDVTNPFEESRSGIWQSSLQDPEYTSDHFLAPENFPHRVFSDSTADCCELVLRQNLSVTGLTQVGDVLMEDSNDYAITVAEE